MGSEFAQFREWDYDNPLEWFMLDYPNHRSFIEYTKELNRFYLSQSELWELDFVNEGFEWISCDDSKKSIIAYKRYNKKREYITVVINFSGSTQSFSMPMIYKGYMKIIFHTGNINEQNTCDIIRQNSENVMCLELPKFSGVILKEQTDKTILNL